MPVMVGRARALLVNSNARRRFGRSALGSRVVGSRSYRSALAARHRLAAARWARRHSGDLAEVRTLCVFIGHTKSGGTLLGALLDAHPHAAFADETDVLRYLTAGFGRDELCYLLVRHARKEAIKGRVTARRLEPYSLAVPGGHQGRHTRLAVVGFSRAGPTTRQLAREPALIDELRTVMPGVGTRFVHVVREPFDPISAMVVRGGRSIDDAVDDYFAQCRRLVVLRALLDPAELLTVRYEDLVTAPVEQVATTCRFLGLDADEGHLRACAAVVRADVPGERRRVAWTQQWRESVRARAADVDFLRGYADADAR